MRVETTDAAVATVGGSIVYEIILPHIELKQLVQLIHPGLVCQLGKKGLELNLQYDVEKMLYLRATQPAVGNPFHYVPPPDHYIVSELVRKLTKGDPWKYEDDLKKMLINKTQIIGKLGGVKNGKYRSGELTSRRQFINKC